MAHTESYIETKVLGHMRSAQTHVSSYANSDQILDSFYETSKVLFLLLGCVSSLPIEGSFLK